MDPVSILGVVGSTAQLIDFTAKLLSTTQSIRRTGSLVEHQDFLKVSAHLERLAKTIQRDLDCSRSVLSQIDTETYELCRNCLKLTHEIESALEDAVRKCPGRAWKSFRQALKLVLGADKLGSLRIRLNLYTQQLNSRLHLKTQQSLDQLKTEIIAHLDTASTQSLQSHEKTREEMSLYRLEAEQREQRLRDELTLLRQGLENCIKVTSKATNQTNKVQQGRLASITNALYQLWAEKQAALDSLMSHLASLSGAEPPNGADSNSPASYKTSDNVQRDNVTKSPSPIPVTSPRTLDPPQSSWSSGPIQSSQRPPTSTSTSTWQPLEFFSSGKSNFRRTKSLGEAKWPSRNNLNETDDSDYQLLFGLAFQGPVTLDQKILLERGASDTRSNMLRYFGGQTSNNDNFQIELPDDEGSADRLGSLVQSNWAR